MRAPPVPDREEADVVAVGDQTPDAARRPDRHGHRDDTEHDQVPGSVRGERLLQDKVDDRPDDRTFQGADAADDRYEDHRGRPLDAEGRRRLDVELADREQPTGGGTPGAGRQVDRTPGPQHRDTEAARADLVVSYGGQSQAGGGAQQQVRP